jgi:hypothetical protein
MQTSYTTHSGETQVVIRSNGDTLIWRARPITSLADPELAQLARNVRSIAERGINGDLADKSLDGICGLLLLIGLSWSGTCMWRQVIQAGRARLVSAQIPAGAMREIWL